MKHKFKFRNIRLTRGDGLNRQQWRRWHGRPKCLCGLSRHPRAWGRKQHRMARNHYESSPSCRPNSPLCRSLALDQWVDSNDEDYIPGVKLLGQVNIIVRQTTLDTRAGGDQDRAVRMSRKRCHLFEGKGKVAEISSRYSGGRNRGALNLRSRQKESERKESGRKFHVVDERRCCFGMRSLLGSLRGALKGMCWVNDRNSRGVRWPKSERRGLLVARVRDGNKMMNMLVEHMWFLMRMDLDSRAYRSPLMSTW